MNRNSRGVGHINKIWLKREQVNCSCDAYFQTFDDNYIIRNFWLEFSPNSYRHLPVVSQNKFQTSNYKS